LGMSWLLLLQVHLCEQRRKTGIRAKVGHEFRPRSFSNDCPTPILSYLFLAINIKGKSEGGEEEGIERGRICKRGRSSFS
jgi:hypothetical protein